MFRVLSAGRQRWRRRAAAGVVYAYTCARVKGEVTSGVHPTSATSAAPSRRAAHIIPLRLLCVVRTRGPFLSVRKHGSTYE